MTRMEELLVEFWGDFACFTPPYAKVERMSYPAPTPSAAIGMLQSIYNKPAEFRWQINRIEVLNPIQYITMKHNELKGNMGSGDSPIFAEEDRTQRQTIALKDVHYRIAAEILPREGVFTGTVEQLYAQAKRRIETGKCFVQPALGCKEFVAYFCMSDGKKKPIPVDIDMGLVVHGMWDPNEYKPTKKCKLQRTLFHCKMEQGVIAVPPYGSNLIIKGD